MIKNISVKKDLRYIGEFDRQDKSWIWFYSPTFNDFIEQIEIVNKPLYEQISMDLNKEFHVYLRNGCIEYQYEDNTNLMKEMNEQEKSEFIHTYRNQLATDINNVLIKDL